MAAEENAAVGSAKMANMTRQFMSRVQLQGNEVMAYVGCMQWLEQIERAAGPAPVEPPADPEAPPAPQKPARRAPRKKG